MNALCAVRKTLTAIVLAALPLQTALADWREEIGTFRVAIAANGDAATTALRAEPFRLALESALGMPVEIAPAKDYPALMDAAARSRVEYAILSANAFAAAHAACECLDPLVIAASGDGASAFRQIIIARTNGPSNIAALKGRKIALIDTGAIGGNLLATHELAAQGLDLTSGEIEVVRFSGSREAIVALAGGSVDALLGWTPEPSPETPARGTLFAMAQAGVNPADYRSVWQSSPVPHRVHAVRRTLDGEAKTILRSLLSSLFSTDPVAYDSVEPVYGGGFLAARQSQFEPLAAAYRSRGIASDAEKK